MAGWLFVDEFHNLTHLDKIWQISYTISAVSLDLFKYMLKAELFATAYSCLPSEPPVRL
jgi:hypothetical protein